MKKLLLALLGITLIVTLAACGSSEEESNGDSNGEDTTEIVVGATSVPHAEVLEEAKPLLEEKGIDLTIETYQAVSYTHLTLPTILLV